MRLSLIHIALTLVGVSAEPIAIGRRDAKGKDPVVQLASQNATYHALEKRFDDCRFTYYAAGLGACGHTNTDSDFIVALNAAQYAGGTHCGATITISYKGKTAQAKIMDLCPGCPYGGLDLTPALFAHFASLNEGVITGSWVFGAGGGSQKEAVVKTTATTSTPKPTPTSTRQATSTTTSTRRTTSTTSTRPAITSRIAIPATSTSSTSTSTVPTTSSSSSSVAGAVSNSQVGSLIDVINNAVLGLGQLAVAAAQANR